MPRQPYPDRGVVQIGKQRDLDKTLSEYVGTKTTKAAVVIGERVPHDTPAPKIGADLAEVCADCSLR